MLATIMIIRHAEKPDPAAAGKGVTSSGKRSKHDLSVTGWQRAGALARLFAGEKGRPLLTPPSTIFAARSSGKSKSKRPVHTVTPLAGLLAREIDDGHGLGDEAGLAAAVLASPMPVLIAWHHERIPLLAQAIAGDGSTMPAAWPDDRFDLVWTLTADERGRWHFAQIAQMLLPGDRDTPIA